MDSLLEKTQEKWWCIHFGQEEIDLNAAKKMKYFFQKITPHVVFGNRKVFLEVSQSKWKKSLYPFQMKIAVLAKKLNLNPERWQWGVGNSVSESWVMARWKTLSPELLPLDAISDFLNPLEVNRNRPNEGYRVRLLRSLGANSLQDLLDIPEDVLLSRCGVWIAEFMREDWLEKVTAASFFQEKRSFQLEDWIPETYLQVA